ncbi:MAG: hypothetical protein HLUCCX10_10375 [Algoriphagus marincola HL-49]|uniref:Lipoprotein n=1 Tax=Algoriphagus marincola HL-49 TaxID=1305737 RepID=A0A0P7Y2P5_9BACT|nr:MAG: hypothetical protein HLUCCX10_10375 [Algoriphagus marincola HL-49]
MKINYGLVLLLFLSSCFAFESDQKVDFSAEMDELYEEIQSLSSSQTCSDPDEWSFVALGSKPCGGHWEYIAYSKQINVPEFLAKVKRYNELQEQDNIQNNRFSDCMYVSPPTGVICEGGKPEFVYD